MARSPHLALASLLASAAVLLIADRLGLVGDAPAVRVAFFALLPTALAANVAADRTGFAVFEWVWEMFARLVDPHAAAGKKENGDDAIREARAELFKAFSERWPTSSTVSTSMARRAAMASNSSQPAIISNATSGKSLYEQVRENLVDHVFPRAVGIPAPTPAPATDAPIYFMDPNTGGFLKVTRQRKLVFTHAPDASCLFHIVRGKTHHWGFHSAIHQRYIGQNFVGKIVLTSKKMNAWESFRVLQRPDDAPNDEEGTRSGAAGGCSPRVYMILCSARFGKGMWLAKNRRANSHGTFHNHSSSSYSQNASQFGFNPSSSTTTSNVMGPPSGGTESALSMSGSGVQEPDRSGAVYLSKHFTNALSLVYASDLSAFEYLSQGTDTSEAETMVTTSSLTSQPLAKLRQHLMRSSAQIPVAQGTAFQPPVLVGRERPRVHLPWLLDDRVKSFFELDESQMTEVLSTVIADFDLSDMLEAVLPMSAREKGQVAKNARDKPTLSLPPSKGSSAVSSVPVLSPQPSTSFSDKDENGVTSSSRGRTTTSPFSEWHVHPHFGYVRKLSYRPPASAAEDESSVDHTMMTNGRGATSIKSIAIDQYHACSVDNEDAPRKLTFRSKMYTLSIPYSNCFSIETLVEIEVADETSIVAANTLVERSSTSSSNSSEHPKLSALTFRCRTGVFFSRDTMFAPQIRRGALEGVKNSCEVLLEVAKELQHGKLLQSVFASSDHGPSDELSFIPRVFALETIKGLVSSILDAGTAMSDSMASLPMQLPWKVFAVAPSSSPFKFDSKPKLKFVAAPSSASTVSSSSAAASTAIPFFESAPAQFARVLEENLGTIVTPRLFFGALLSDECAFFRSTKESSGNMDVDIGAWRVMPRQIGAAASSGRHHRHNSSSQIIGDAATAFVRKQAFRMPLSGIPGVEVARIEDYQYHAFVARPAGGEAGETAVIDPSTPPPFRLEFGMKLFAPDLPDGDTSSVRDWLSDRSSVEPATDCDV